MKKRRLQRNMHNENGDVLTPEEEALLHDLSGMSHAGKPLPPPLVLPGIPAAGTDGQPDEADETEEDALLRALLQSAYPAPPEHLRRDVMAKIGVMAGRRKMRRAVLKWGSAAACFVILCSLTILASPMLRKGAAVTEMALPETQFASVADAALLTSGTEAADTSGAYENEAAPVTILPEAAPDDVADDTPREGLLFATAPESAEEKAEAEREGGESADDADRKHTGDATSDKNKAPSNSATEKNPPSNSGPDKNKTPSNSGAEKNKTPSNSGPDKNKTPSNSGTDKNKTPSNSGTDKDKVPSNSATEKGNTPSNSGADKSSASSGGTTSGQSASGSANTGKSETTAETDPPRRFLNPGGAQVTTNGAAETSAETGSTGNRPLLPPRTDASTPTGGAVHNPSTGGSSGTTGNSSGTGGSSGTTGNNPGTAHGNSDTNASGNASKNTSPADGSERADASTDKGDLTAEDRVAPPENNALDAIDAIDGVEKRVPVSLTSLPPDATADDAAPELATDSLTESKVAAKNAVNPVFVAENQVKWALVSYIPPEKYANWMMERGYQTAADFTLAELVHGMQISHETFHAIVAVLGLERIIDEKLYFPELDAPAPASGCQNVLEGRSCMENAAIRNSVK